MAETYKVFLSAVTNEFGAVRDRIAADLRSRGLTVKVQSDFRSEKGADTVLTLLHNYIRECDEVVCVVGQRSGGVPQPAEVAPYLSRNILPDGIAEASYTQWEFFFARHHERELSIFFADEKYPAEQQPAPANDRPDLQRDYVRYIERLGLHRIPFATPGDLRAEILRKDWPHFIRDKPVVLPYPSLGGLFKGRDEFLRRLRESLIAGGQGYVSHAAIVSQAVYGLGGIGKTRAAVEYAHAYSGDYSAIFLVVAETAEALHRNLAALAERLGLPEAQATEEARRVAGVSAWLNANPGWLLILDNLDSREALQAATALTAPLKGGHVLITSRLGNFPPAVRRLPLDVLEIDDAAAFLIERTEGGRRKAADDDVAARELATALGGLALALEHAGAYIESRREILRAYLALWRDGNEAVMAWCDPAVSNYERTTAATVQLSVEKLTPQGRALLERIAFLAPEPIPESLLDVAIPGVAADELKAALADLAAYSLATRNDDPPSFAVHRLVQELICRSLATELSIQRRAEALNWVNKAFTGDPEDEWLWLALDPLAPHVLVVAQHANQAGIAEPTGRLLSQLGILFGSEGRYEEAEPLLRRVLAINEENLGSRHSVVAICLNNLASLLEKTGRPREAEQLMLRSLAIDEQNFGREDVSVASRLSNLGVLLNNTDRMSEDEPLLRRALAIDEKKLPPGHPNIAIRLNNLGFALKGTHRFEEAEQIYRRALAITEAHRGADHPEVAIRLNNLAELLLDTDRHAEAEPLSRRHLQIILDFERQSGHEHPLHEAAIINYARLLEVMGKSEVEIIEALRALGLDVTQEPTP
jgi:tetratricopeptide (TPR) repeat protein